MGRIEDLLEAESLGILPPAMLADLQEARGLGLVPAAVPAAAPQPSPASLVQGLEGVGGGGPSLYAGPPMTFNYPPPEGGISALARGLGEVATAPQRATQMPANTVGEYLTRLGQATVPFMVPEVGPMGAFKGTRPEVAAPEIPAAAALPPTVPPRTMSEYISQSLQGRPATAPLQQGLEEAMQAHPPPVQEALAPDLTGAALGKVPETYLDPLRQGIEDALRTTAPKPAPTFADLTGAALRQRRAPATITSPEHEPGGFNWETGEQSGPYPFHPPETAQQIESARASIAEGEEVLQQPLRTVSASTSGTPLLAHPIRETDPLSVFVTKRGGFSRGGFEGETREMRGRGVPPGLLRTASTRLTNEELATEAFQAGYISEPTADALVRGLQEDTTAAAQGNLQGRLLSYRGRELTQDQRYEEQARAYYEAQEQALALAQEHDPAKIRAAVAPQGDLIDRIHAMSGAQEPPPEFVLTSEGPGIRSGDTFVDPTGKEVQGTFGEEFLQRPWNPNKITTAQPQKDITETPLFGQKRLAHEEQQAAAQRTLGEVLGQKLTEEKGAAPILHDIAAQPAGLIRGTLRAARFLWDRGIKAPEDVMIDSNPDLALLANMARGVEERTQRMSGRFQFLVEKAIKDAGLNDAGEIHVEDFLDGRGELVPAGGLTPAEGQAASQIRNLLNEYRALGRELGIEMELKGERPQLRTQHAGGSIPFTGLEDDYLGRYLKPAMFDKTSDLYKKMRDWVVANRGLSEQTVETIFTQQIALARGKALQFGSLERGRGVLNLPKEAYVEGLRPRLMLYNERAANRLEMVHTFGPDNWKAWALLNLANDVNPEAANFAARKFNEFAKIAEKDTAAAAFAQSVRNFQNIFKLGPTTAVSQVSQIAMGAMRTNFRSMVKALINRRYSQEVAMRGGQMLRATQRQMLEGFGAPTSTVPGEAASGAERYMRWVGHTGMDQFARNEGAGMGAFYADELVQKLLAKPDSWLAGFWTRRLEEMNVDIPKMLRLRKEIEAAGAPLSPLYLDETVKAGQRVANDVNFRYSVLSTPDLFSTPSGSIFLQFKRWMVDSSKFVGKHVIGEALKGNPNPLLVLLGPTGFLTGEFIADMRSILRSQNPMDPEGRGGALAKAVGRGGVDLGDVLGNYVQNGLFALFTDTLQAIHFGKDSMVEFAVGPFYSQLIHVLQALYRSNEMSHAKQYAVRARSWDPLKEEFLKEFTPMGGSLGRPLARAWYPHQPPGKHKTLGAALGR